MLNCFVSFGLIILLLLHFDLVIYKQVTKNIIFFIIFFFFSLLTIYYILNEVLLIEVYILLRMIGSLSITFCPSCAVDVVNKLFSCSLSRQ